jgi:hypothetical protein
MSIQHMQTVFDAQDLTAPQKAVLLAYCNFTDPHGYCWPGVERIADMTGLSVSGVKKVRKQLLDVGLLVTVKRGKSGGGRTTNASRINVKRLESMRRPDRVYDDNLVPGLGFEEDTEEGAKVPVGHTNGSRGDRQRYLGGTNEGTSGDPYPSVDPSGDPSGDPSSSSEPAAEKATRKRKTPEQIVTERTGCTEDEAAAVVDLIETQAAAAGTRIRSITTWITGRPDRDLQRDLAAARRRTRPTAAKCGLHATTLHGGGCSLCMGDIKAGDADVIRAHLAQVGGDARPDLVTALGAPAEAPRSLADTDMGAYWRSINKPRNGGYTPFANPADQSVYDEPLLPPARAGA